MFFKKENNQTIWVGLSFLIVGLGAGLLIGKGGLFATQESEAQSEAIKNFDPKELETVSASVDNDPILGDPNAPITIVEFSDYQCAFCREFAKETLPSLIRNYVDEGIVKIVFRDFPIPPDRHPQAGLAAEAAECVRAYASENADETYFEMHDLIFGNVVSWSGQINAKEVLVSLAKEELGIDIQTCLDSGEMTEEVQSDYVAGKGYGVGGTPTFFINGKKLVGAWPYEVFEIVIESLR